MTVFALQRTALLTLLWATSVPAFATVVTMLFGLDLVGECFNGCAARRRRAA